MKIFYFLFFILVSNASMSHECVLQGTSAKEITIYNSCKADKSKNKPVIIDFGMSYDKTLLNLKNYKEMLYGKEKLKLIEQKYKL